MGFICLSWNGWLNITISQSLAQYLAHKIIDFHWLTKVHPTKQNKGSPLKALLSLLLRCHHPPSPSTSQQWKSLNMLFVALQPFAFKLGVSLSHFISYSSYQPREVSAVICILQARALRGEATCPGPDHTRSCWKKWDLHAQLPPFQPAPLIRGAVWP